MPPIFDTILVIDDVEPMLRTVVRILKKYDYRVLTANSGNKGIVTFEADNVDIIISDLMMPDGDGFVVLKYIHNNSPETPVIIVSGLGERTDVIKAINEGAYDYIEKPVSKSLLIHSVENALERLKMWRKSESDKLELRKIVQTKTRQLKLAIKNLSIARDLLIKSNQELDEAMVTSQINEAKYRALINKSPIGISVINSNYSISEANPAFLRVFGFSSVEELRKIDILTSPAFMNSGITSNLLKCMKKAEECSFVEECSLDDNANKWVKCYLTPIKTQGFYQDILLLIEDVSLRKKAEKKSEEDAMLCKLSGLLNQNNFLPTLEKQISNVKAKCYNLALVYIDIDDFKKINDTLGHPGGDELIKAVGKRIQRAISKDIDCGFRVGGDEFAVIFTQYQNNSIRGIVERFFDQLKKPYAISAGRMENITFSLGIAEYSNQSAKELYDAADKVTYDSKKAGKNTCSYY
ncbi:MAG: diguanylate cyclase [bacterium]|nr:diguanylate cyclase [bacterium]